MPDGAKVPVNEMSLEQLEHARELTEAILEQHMGANIDVDREIVEKARIRLQVLEYAIKKRKDAVFTEEDVTGPHSLHDEVTPREGHAMQPAESDLKEPSPADDSRAEHGWKVGRP